MLTFILYKLTDYSLHESRTMCFVLQSIQHFAMASTQSVFNRHLLKDSLWACSLILVGDWIRNILNRAEIQWNKNTHVHNPSTFLICNLVMMPHLAKMNIGSVAIQRLSIHSRDDTGLLSWIAWPQISS